MKTIFYHIPSRKTLELSIDEKTAQLYNKKKKSRTISFSLNGALLTISVIAFCICVSLIYSWINYIIIPSLFCIMVVCLWNLRDPDKFIEPILNSIALEWHNSLELQDFLTGIIEEAREYLEKQNELYNNIKNTLNNQKNEGQYNALLELEAEQVKASIVHAASRLQDYEKTYVFFYKNVDFNFFETSQMFSREFKIAIKCNNFKKLAKNS